MLGHKMVQAGITVPAPRPISMPSNTSQMKEGATENPSSAKPVARQLPATTAPVPKRLVIAPAQKLDAAEQIVIVMVT